MDRCALCTGEFHCIGPSGPADAEVLFIGEAPGRDEEKHKRVFVGKTGQEVDGHYLPLAGLRREKCRFINTVACWPSTGGHKLDLKRAGDRALVESCAMAHLYQEIVRMQPKLLVPMGAIACHAIDPDIDLEVQHGLVVQTRWGIPAFPMYHPARGLHEPKRMRPLRADWTRLRLLHAGRLPIYRDDYPDPDYREVTEVRELDELDPTLPLAADTETSRRLGAFVFTFSQSQGTARLVRATRPDLLARLQQSLNRWESDIYFHSYLHDRPVTRTMGVAIPDHVIRDTYLWAFHLGTLPLGLKAMAYRELGMVMQDFLDVVTPHSAALVLDYYRQAQTIDWPKPIEELELDSKTGLLKLKKPQSMNTKLKRFFTDLSKDPTKDPFNMWETNWVNAHAMLEEQLGPWPGLDIAHVPFETMLHYACRDADALIRLAPVLLQMRTGVGVRPPERWRVA